MGHSSLCGRLHLARWLQRHRWDGKLNKESIFQTFVVSDTIALMLSVSAVFFYFLMALVVELSRTIWLLLFLCASYLTMFGMEAMVVAFMTGLYAVLPHSFGLPILTFSCILGSFFYPLASYFIY